jgi:hypothetical protein
MMPRVAVVAGLDAVAQVDQAAEEAPVSIALTMPARHGAL